MLLLLVPCRETARAHLDLSSSTWMILLSLTHPAARRKTATCTTHNALSIADHTRSTMVVTSATVTTRTLSRSTMFRIRRALTLVPSFHELLTWELLTLY